MEDFSVGESVPAVFRPFVDPNLLKAPRPTAVPGDHQRPEPDSRADLILLINIAEVNPPSRVGVNKGDQTEALAMKGFVQLVLGVLAKFKRERTGSIIPQLVVEVYSLGFPTVLFHGPSPDCCTLTPTPTPVAQRQQGSFYKRRCDDQAVRASGSRWYPRDGRWSICLRKFRYDASWFFLTHAFLTFHSLWCWSMAIRS
jgi:hypothetical protein